MDNRSWLIVLITIAMLGWYFSPSPTPAPAVSALPETTPLPSPPRLEDRPIQNKLRQSQTVTYAETTLELMAEYSITARVLAKKDYRDKQADISRTDLALGWGMASHDDVLQHLNISQGGRWYRYRYEGDIPFSAREFARHSANTHIIAASAAVQEAIDSIHKDDVVSLQGFLVTARKENERDKFEWRSSLTRDDTGAGACELFYVLRVNP